MFALINMSGGLRSFFYRISLVLFLICSSGIQTQAVTWTTYGSMYNYTEESTLIIYQDGKKYDEGTFTDSLMILNVTAVGDKVYFQTNFTPYFMGLVHFETQQEYDEYLEEHYWCDSNEGNMTIAYSVVDTDFRFVDMLDYTIAYNTTITDFDIRFLYQEIYGLFLPVNHTLFNFKTEYTTRIHTEQAIHDVVFEQEDSFVLDKMKYDGYYLSLEYVYYTTMVDITTWVEITARFEYKTIAMYSLKGELYHYEISEFIRNDDNNDRIQYYETSLTLDAPYRENGVRLINFASPIIILGSLLIATYILTKRRKS